jgi:putative Ca2+/H+ antiporter (TMEM165/GDT1 family)
MFWKTAAIVFVTVFLAEIGDKTQLATMLFSAKAETSKRAVFASSATGIGVLVSGLFERAIAPHTLKILAGVGFILVGVWTLWPR